MEQIDKRTETREKEVQQRMQKWRKQMNNREASEEECKLAWKKYNERKKKVKYIIAKVKIEYKRNKVEELKEKGEERGNIGTDT